MIEYFCHESSYVDDDVDIGSGTKIWHFSHILSGSKIGKNCSIGQNVVIGPNVVIGDNCKIQNNVSVYDGLILEDDVFLGPSKRNAGKLQKPSNFGQMFFKFFF